MQGNDACGESTFVSVWTYGKPGFCYPDEAGIRIGPAYHHVAQLQASKDSIVYVLGSVISAGTFVYKTGPAKFIFML